MCRYKHVLIATDDGDTTQPAVGRKARLLAKISGARLSLIFPAHELTQDAAAYQLPSLVDVEASYVKQMKRSMKAVGKRLGVDEQDQALRIASFKKAVLQEARQQDPDLVVLSDRRHKSAANALLQHTHCDILAVHS